MTLFDGTSLQDSIRVRCHSADSPRLGFADAAGRKQTLCDRFREVVERFPTNPAVKDSSEALDYLELDEQSSGLASRLLQSGLGAEERIGLLVTADVRSIVAQVAILRAGHVSVLLNVSYPPQRLREIIKACNIRCVVTQTSLLPLAKSLAQSDSQLINLDRPDLFGACKLPDVQIHPTTPTAIGYSSGSTGVPKQTARDHINDLHFIQRVSDSIGIHSGDRILVTMGTLLMPFLALANGGCYHPADLRQDGDLAALASRIQEEEITILRAPVSTFRALCQSLLETDTFPNLRLIVLQGEPVFRADVEAYKEKFSDHCVLVSSLGVSEFGDFCHFFVDKSSEIRTPTVPGGYPLDGVEVSLLKDEEDEELGELGISGPFISGPTAQRIGGHIYATGDLGKEDPDGCIHLSGRKDFQVKVRGNRVDILEVEAAILDLEGISQTAVVGHTNSKGDVRLVAYIESPPSDSGIVRRELKAQLPDFMIPSLVQWVDELPRTLTGKVDRNSLPSPEFAQPSVEYRERETQEDLSDTSRKIMGIWREVLQRNQIGMNERFLDIGGDSLLAQMVLNRINRTFGVRLTMLSIFQAETVVSIAEVVDSHLERMTG